MMQSIDQVLANIKSEVVTRYRNSARAKMAITSTNEAGYTAQVRADIAMQSAIYQTALDKLPIPQVKSVHAHVLDEADLMNGSRRKVA